MPAQVGEIIARAREALPGVRLRAHFHNTRNTGIANTHAAVAAGSMRSMRAGGGIGGCPFAPAATGNIPTEDLVYMLERSNVTNRGRSRQLIATGAKHRQTLGKPVPSMLLKAGGFPKPAQRAA
ncbi:MAG: hypothetical protein U1F11_12055 [Steroidobacteraceae bacterium]